LIARSGLLRALLLPTLLLLALSARAEEPGPALRGSVTWVHDGDTLEIKPFGRTRLIGIDTPEREDSPRDRFLAQQGVPASRQRAISRAAKTFNIQHVKGQQVTLTLDTPARDKYGRLLAYVYLPDGRLLNALLLEKGLAAVYRKFSFRMKEDFLAAEAAAREARRGLWAESQP